MNCLTENEYIISEFFQRFSKEINHLSHPGFLTFRNFETRFEVLQLPAQRGFNVFRWVSERIAKDFIGTGSENTLFRGVL